MRSSASRAYYAAFHMAMEKAQQEGYSPAGSGDDHRQVQKHFQEAKNGREEQRRARRKIGTELDRLRDLRNKADYDNSLDRQADSLAAHALGMAKRIVDLIQAL